MLLASSSAVMSYPSVKRFVRVCAALAIGLAIFGLAIAFALWTNTDSVAAATAKCGNQYSATYPMPHRGVFEEVKIVCADGRVYIAQTHR